MEILRTILLCCTAVGYLSVAHRTPWRSLPIFGLWLVAQAIHAALRAWLGPYDVRFFPVTDSIVTTLTFLVAWEAGRRLLRFSAPGEWLAVLQMGAALVVIGALLCFDLFLADPLEGIKSFRHYTHTGLLLSGLATALYFSMSHPTHQEREATHGSIFLCLMAANVAAGMSHPKAGEWVKWYVVSCLFQMATLACQYAWWRVMGSAAAAAGPSAYLRPPAPHHLEYQR